MQYPGTSLLFLEVFSKNKHSKSSLASRYRKKKTFNCLVSYENYIFSQLLGGRNFLIQDQNKISDDHKDV